MVGEKCAWCAPGWAHDTATPRKSTLGEGHAPAVVRIRVEKPVPMLGGRPPARRNASRPDRLLDFRERLAELVELVSGVSESSLAMNHLVENRLLKESAGINRLGVADERAAAVSPASSAEKSYLFSEVKGSRLASP